jgi:arginine deiminase
VIVAGMPKLRAAMHLDTVFTFADRDVVTLYPDIVDAVQTFTLMPSDAAPGVEVIEANKPFVEEVADALGLGSFCVVETGGNSYDSERQQWDSGNNLVAVEPGVVFAYDRNTHTNSLLRKAGIGPSSRACGHRASTRPWETRRRAACGVTRTRFSSAASLSRAGDGARKDWQ